MELIGYDIASLIVLSIIFGVGALLFIKRKINEENNFMDPGTEFLHIKQILSTRFMDPGSEFLHIKQILSTRNWKIVDTGDDDYFGSLSISILQALSKHYGIKGRFEDLVYGNPYKKDWNELIACILPSLKTKLLPTLIKLKNSKATPTDFVQEIQLLTNKCSKPQILFVTTNSVVETTLDPNQLYILEFNQEFYPVVPEENYYLDTQNYVNGVVSDIYEFNYIGKIFETWVTKHSKNNFDKDPLNLCSFSETVQIAIKNAKTLTQIHNILLESFELTIGQDLILLEKLIKLLNQLELPSEILSVFHEIQAHILKSFQKQVEFYFINLREINHAKSQRTKSHYNELLENQAELQYQINELEQKLKVGNEINSEQNSNLRNLQAQLAWENFKLELFSAKLNQRINIKQLEKLDLPLIIDELKLCTKFPESLHNESFLNLIKTVDNLPKYKTELLNLLQEISDVQPNYDKENKTVTFIGQNIFVSDCLQRLGEYSGFETLYIIGLASANIDANMPNETFHSKNISIIGTTIEINSTSTITIDVSGLNGIEKKSKPPIPDGPGIIGQRGDNGNNGEPSGHVYIKSKTKIDNFEKLIIRSIGGNGGKGQDGGDGSDGKAGDDGKPGNAGISSPKSGRLLFSKGGEGLDGQNGGLGGLGGQGGLPGAGGQIIIETENSKQLIVTNNTVGQLLSENGKPGANGDVGKSGDGGIGGKHGYDDVWATYSGWFFHKWDRYKNGFYKEIFHDTAFATGYTVEEDLVRKNKPKANDGKRVEQKQTQQTIEQTISINYLKKQGLNLARINSFYSKEKHSSSIPNHQKIEHIKKKLFSQGFLTTNLDLEAKANLKMIEENQRKLDDNNQKLIETESEQENELLKEFQSQELCKQIEEFNCKIMEELKIQQSYQLQQNVQSQYSISIDNYGGRKYGIMSKHSEEIEPIIKKNQTSHLIQSKIKGTAEKQILNISSYFQNIKKTHQLNFEISESIESFLAQIMAIGFPEIIPSEIQSILLEILENDNIIGMYSVSEFLKDIFPKHLKVILTDKYQTGNIIDVWNEVIFPSSDYLSNNQSITLIQSLFQLHTTQYSKEQLFIMENYIRKSKLDLNNEFGKCLFDILQNRVEYYQINNFLEVAQETGEIENPEKKKKWMAKKFSQIKSIGKNIYSKTTDLWSKVGSKYSSGDEENLKYTLFLNCIKKFREMFRELFYNFPDRRELSLLTTIYETLENKIQSQDPKEIQNNFETFIGELIELITGIGIEGVIASCQNINNAGSNLKKYKAIIKNSNISIEQLSEVYEMVRNRMTEEETFTDFEHFLRNIFNHKFEVIKIRDIQTYLLTTESVKLKEKVEFVIKLLQDSNNICSLDEIYKFYETITRKLSTEEFDIFEILNQIQTKIEKSGGGEYIEEFVDLSSETLNVENQWKMKSSDSLINKLHSFIEQANSEQEQQMLELRKLFQLCLFDLNHFLFSIEDMILIEKKIRKFCADSIQSFNFDELNLAITGAWKRTICNLLSEKLELKYELNENKIEHLLGLFDEVFLKLCTNPTDEESSYLKYKLQIIIYELIQSGNSQRLDHLSQQFLECQTKITTSSEIDNILNKSISIFWPDEKDSESNKKLESYIVELENLMKNVNANLEQDFSEMIQQLEKKFIKYTLTSYFLERKTVASAENVKVGQADSISKKINGIKLKLFNKKPLNIQSMLDISTLMKNYHTKNYEKIVNQHQEKGTVKTLNRQINLAKIEIVGCFDKLMSISSLFSASKIIYPHIEYIRNIEEILNRQNPFKKFQDEGTTTKINFDQFIQCTFPTIKPSLMEYLFDNIDKNKMIQICGILSELFPEQVFVPLVKQIYRELKVIRPSDYVELLEKAFITAFTQIKAKEVEGILTVIKYLYGKRTKACLRLISQLILECSIIIQSKTIYQSLGKYISTKSLDNPNSEKVFIHNLFFSETDPWTREIIVRCINMNQFPRIIYELDQSFGNNVTKLFTPNEKILWDSIEYKDPILIDLFYENPSNWEELLFWKVTCQPLKSQLNETSLNEKERKEIYEGINEWRVQLVSSGCSSEWNDEEILKFLISIFSNVLLSPISIFEFQQIFQHVGFLSWDQTVHIFTNYLPFNWNKIISIELLYGILQSKYPVQNQTTTKIYTKLKSMLYEDNNQVSDFLYYFAHKLYDPNEVLPELTTFENIMNQIIQSQFNPTLFEMLNSSKSTCEWNIILRSHYYTTNYPTVSSSSLIQLILQVEEKHGVEQVQELMKILNQKIKISEPVLEQYFNNFLNGEWILNQTLLQQLQLTKNPTSGSIKVLFNHYMSNYNKKIVEDEDLIDSFLKINRNLPSERNKLISDLKSIKDRSKDLWKQVPKNRKIKEKLVIDNFLTQYRSKEYMSEKSQNEKYDEFRLELLVIINIAVRMCMDYYLRDTQILSILQFLYGQKQGVGRFGEISTSEGKTLISAVLAIHLGLGGFNVNIITSSSRLAIEALSETTKPNKLKQLYNLLGINVANICDDSCRKDHNYEKELESRYGCKVLYGDASSFEGDILYNRYLGKTYMRNREADYLIVDEVDSMLLDKGSQILYISHLIPELRYLRHIFIDIWNTILCNPGSKLENIYKTIGAKIDRKDYSIPQSLIQFTQKRLKEWITNALVAKNEMEEDDPYKLTDKVTVMDNETGMSQSNTQYSYALHQFLQLKHFKRLTSESLKGIFISNLTFFKGYSGKIFGITGTMGSTRSKEFLKTHYNVDFFKMPRYKIKKCNKETGIIVRTEEEHLSQIQKSVDKRATEQPTLIISQNVLKAKKLLQFLKSKAPDGRVLSYLDSKENDEATDTSLKSKPIGPGDILVSTNIAGRGTDLEILCEQGLHVVLTYVPPNERIEKQAFGRTSRAGKRGSTQYIIQEIQEYTKIGIEISINAYRKILFEHEDTRIESLDKLTVPKIQKEEDLLKQFITNITKNLPHFVGNIKDSKVIKAIKQCADNRWAFWLDSIQSQLKSEVSRLDLDSKFNEFWSNLSSDFRKSHYCTLSSEYVKLARPYEESYNVDEAKALLKNAMNLEPKFNEISNYYYAALLCKDEKNTVESKKEIRKYLKKSVKTINERKDLLKQFHSTISTWKGTVSNANNNSQSSLTIFDQIQNEMDLYNVHLREIEEIIGAPSISSNIFMSMSQVHSDENEAQDIFNGIIQNLGLDYIKGYRISKKISCTDRDGTGKFTTVCNKYGEKLTLVEVGSLVSKEYLENRIAELLLKYQKGKFIIHPDEIQVTNMENIWKHMSTLNIFHSSIEPVESEFIEFKEEPFGSLPIDVEEKLMLGNQLRELNGRILENTSIYKSYSNIYFNLLRDRGILVKVKVYKGQLKSNFMEIILDKSCNGGDNELLIRLTNPPYLQNENSITIIQHPNEPNEVKNDILEQLIENHFVKSYKVNWNLKQKFGVEEKFIKSLKEELRKSKRLAKVFDKYQQNIPNSKYSDYIESITKCLVNSVGKLKSLQKVEFQNYGFLSSHVSQKDFMNELHDFYEEDFDRIPTVRKQIPWFNSGAFWVSMIGILQIIAGVTTMVCSGGTLTNLGMILISEGGSDLIFATQAGLTGEFSWSSYGINKAFSIAVSVATGGMAGLTGARLGTRVAMEVAEEVVKKSLFSIAREVAVKTLYYTGKYALQGLATLGISATIEKALDTLRETIVNKFREGALIVFKPGEKFEFELSLASLRVALNTLYESSYRPNQAEAIISNALESMNPSKPSSYAAALGSTVKRMAIVASTFISEKLSLGSGKYNLLFGQIQKLLKTTCVKKDIRYYALQMKNFVIEYINKLVAHFENEANYLRERRAAHIQTYGQESIKKSTQQEFETVVNEYTNELPVTIFNHGLEQLQKELFEPEMKLFTSKLVDMGFNRVFKSSFQNNQQQNNDESFWSKLFNYSKDCLRVLRCNSNINYRQDHNTEWKWKYWFKIRPNTYIKSLGKTVENLVNMFKGSLRFCVDRLNANNLIPVILVDKYTTDEYREKAIQMNIRVIRKIEL